MANAPRAEDSVEESPAPDRKRRPCLWAGPRGDRLRPLHLTVGLRYQGSLPYIAAAQKLPSGMVEEQIFAVGLSSFLSSVVPDRLDSSCDNAACEMTLYLET